MQWKYLRGFAKGNCERNGSGVFLAAVATALLSSPLRANEMVSHCARLSHPAHPLADFFHPPYPPIASQSISRDVPLARTKVFGDRALHEHRRASSLSSHALSKVACFSFPGRVPMLVYVRPSNEALLRARVPGAQDQCGCPSLPLAAQDKERSAISG